MTKTEALNSIKALHFYPMANGIDVDLIGVGGEMLMSAEYLNKEG